MLNVGIQCFKPNLRVLNLKMTDTKLNFWVIWALFCMLICIMCHFLDQWQIMANEVSN